MDLSNIFLRNKISLRLNLPKTIKSIHTDEKLKFIGTKGDIVILIKEIRKIALLKEGQLAKLRNYTLKVSDHRTEDRFKENWIEFPAWVWAIMASKFLEVTEGLEENPFYFNSCGCTDESPLDIGVEVSDLNN